jgi:ribulose 1,5-bisphosphate synthetase/thiazole synthase
MDINGSKTIFRANASQARTLENYDLVILGGGTGSTVAASTFVSQGQRVAVIECKYASVELAKGGRSVRAT